MTAFTSSFQWDRYLGHARVLLGLSALISELLAAQRPRGFFAMALTVFLVYSVVVSLRRRSHSRVFGLLALFGDTVFFLILADHGTGQSIWFPTIFFMYLMVEAVALFGPREVIVVVAIAALFCTATRKPHLAMLARIVMAAGTITVAFSVNRKRLEGRIEALTKEAETAREAALTAADTERQRIASDFHDGALQSFISLQMRLEICRKLLDRDREAGMEELQQLQVLAQAQVRELRAFVRSMRPVDLDGANLFAAGRRIAENFHKESGIPVTFVGGDKPLAMAQEAAAEVLQMLRESLNNVHKHAGATRVAVAIEKADKALEVSVDDNGRGFHFSGSYTLEELELLRLGPASLKRRARSLNADMNLESRPGRGAGLKFRIPL
ncbi:MAG TPA: sensor histidine kinase [Bryobacteraceae bacterium]|nr:sensor histidine kinase [Bryobacteraceae bacterium]